MPIKRFLKTKLIPAVKPKSLSVYFVAYSYAFILVLFCVAQLFKFEDFVEVIISFNFINSRAISEMIAIIIVLVELMALPFLLRLSLPKCLRIISIAAGYLVPNIWLASSIWVLSRGEAVDNIGFLSSVISLPAGIWAVTFSVGVLLLAILSSYGLCLGRKAH